MHIVRRSHEHVTASSHVFAGHSDKYTETPLINHEHGSVHTGLTLCRLAPGGWVAPHLHSFEESVYLLAGDATLLHLDEAYTLGPGDFGVFKVGTLHGWANPGSTELRWLQMAAPQPKPAGRERDTFFPKSVPNPPVPKGLSRSEQKALLLGHFDQSEIGPTNNDLPAGVASNVFLKWMIDEKLGAKHHRMLFIEYQPGANIAMHDHTFEEAYYILSGEVQATMDGDTQVIRAGDVVWTGVGCMHAFANVSTAPVRWIETFSPQPPAENVFRFKAEWDKKAAELES